MHVDVIILTLAVVMTLGIIAYLFSEKMHISLVPILMILGLLFGSVLGIIERNVAHELFKYVRVFGLTIILFAEGHNLKWTMLKRHMATIFILDTAGLFVTAIVSAFFFSLFFHLPFLVGFLFGSIISATDPATLIPLFKQHKINENVKTVLVTESIFNDPLGIVLTSLAIALLLPQASSASFIESISHYTTLYPGAVIFFLYAVGVSILLGLAFGIFGYWFIRVFKLQNFSEIYSLALAFSGFFIGEWLHASGYLVATVTGIVLGNHAIFFKRRGFSDVVDNAIIKESHFNEILADFSTILIFVLLGASLDLKQLENGTLIAVAVAITVILFARPLAGLTILPLKKWTKKEYLFLSLEGPRGVVPSALASLPLTLGLTYKDPQMIGWGETILTATVMTVLTSVIIETLWMPVLNRKLLKNTLVKKW